MKVPLLDVNAQNHPLREEITDAFNRVFDSGRFIMGPEVEALEKECAEFVGARHAIGVSSGTDAILVALMAAGIGPGDEVLVPTFTFFATAGCVSRVGATPVFVDSCPVCFNIDINKAKAKITERTKAIIPVHLFGQAADMDAVMTLAGKHDLKVIEDAAQSIGARHRACGCGTIGDWGTYSFFPSKNLGGFGDGGMVVTGDDELFERTRVMRMHGSKPKYYHKLVGGNFRLDALQAAMLRVKLRHYPGYTSARQRNADYYSERLVNLPGVTVADPHHCKCPTAQAEALSASEARIVLPVAYPHNEHIWNQYTLRVMGDGRRDALREHLGKAGIGSEIYYPVTMDQQECFADTPEASRSDCEVAHQLAKEVLSIPIYPELSDEQKDAVIESIGGFLG